jgi:hypothetical protein
MPRSIQCVTEAHVAKSFSPSPDDLVVGPLTWPGLRGWATADPSGFGDPASGDFKIGAQVAAGTTVTVAVAAEARAYAGLNYGQTWSYSPAQAVTFHACPDTDTAYIGGFHVTGRRCVPFDVTVKGQASAGRADSDRLHRLPTRIVVSFFNGRCP